VSDVPPPVKQRKPDRLAGAREGERLSVGSYFQQHKRLVDERRGALARLGMDERHVEALRMPAREEPPMEPRGTPAVQPVEAKLPDEAETLAPAPRRLPKGAPMAHDLEE
jgi:hypothetical protein